MKRLFFSIVFVLLITAISSISQASVGGVCSNCHTMHNSQNGQPMATYGSSNPEGAGTGTKEGLLRGSCFGCHAQMTGEYIVTISSSKVPQVYHSNASRDMAGGNFGYITEIKGDAPPSYPSSSTEQGYDAKGHNIKQLGDVEDGITGTFPPGDQHTTGITQTGGSALTCAGAYGCHGNRATTGNYAAIKGAHHTDDSTINGNTVGTSFRFLKGVLGLENNESNYEWQDYNDSHHNEYKGDTSPGTSEKTTPAGGTISGFCAECHGYYHGGTSDEMGEWGGTPWRRHPTDIVLKNSGEYTAYTTYSTVTPVARTSVPGSPSSTVTPGADVVMCLSCHGAHATNYFKMVRWDRRASYSGCSICHTSKKKY